MPELEIAALSGRTFEAILFDLDGTLVDTEPQTGEAIALVMRNYGVEHGSLPTALTSGQSWVAICRSLEEKYPKALDAKDLKGELIDCWDQLVREVTVPIPGAVQAVEASAGLFSLGVVSSSPRFLVDLLLEKIEVSRWVESRARVGGDEVLEPKPRPEGFLTCAGILGVEPSRCLVFEDSLAGVTAAKAAGMMCVLILETCGDVEACLALADASIQNFEHLPSQFWRGLVPQRCSSALVELSPG